MAKVECDIQTNKIHKQKIAHVVQDEFVINNIDPTQACYIGMQAGYKVFRKPFESPETLTNFPILRLVK